MSRTNNKVTPPVATIKPREITVHGQTRIDDYYWLREKKNTEVIAYLKAENDYTNEMMAQTRELQKKLYDEMVDRIKETDSTAPVKSGKYFYYSRTEKGKQYSIFCRKRDLLDAEEEIILDLNTISAEGNHDYLSLGLFKISPEHDLLAYSMDTDGGEYFTLSFKDLTTGDLLPDKIPMTSYSAEWANDNKTLFYTVQDETKRSHKLYRHVLGSNPDNDELLYHEEDPLFNVHLYKTKDKSFVVLYLNSIETTEARIINADEAKGNFRLIHSREKGVRYVPRHHKGRFYILTNHDAQNFRLMMVEAKKPGKPNWSEVIPHRDKVLVEDVELFDDHMVLYERENGLKTLRIINLKKMRSHYIRFPETVYSFHKAANPEFDSNLLRFNYMSMTTADSVIDYNMKTREWTLVKMKPVLGGYDPSNYETERFFAPSNDGTRVPISLVYRKGLIKNGEAHCLLYGYGSYGISMEPSFDSKRLSLIDRGFIYAIAHVRGGQDMGRNWYDSGKFLNKKNTFTDFISCARHLITEKFTSSEKLAIMGRSAGGLLIGAVVNRAPELFKVVVAGVPFVDVVTTMLDDSIPLTVGEYEEWGDPREKEYYDYMLSYSPYDNVEAKSYPNMLITAGLNDPRVQYWEPAKWTAKLRRLKTDGKMLLLKTFMGAGHFSSSGRYDYLKDLAFEYAFILEIMGIKE